jgi:hypothetical protein
MRGSRYSRHKQVEGERRYRGNLCLHPACKILTLGELCERFDGLVRPKHAQMPVCVCQLAEEHAKLAGVAGHWRHGCRRLLLYARRLA